uniref:Uncharacterized protein n=1 Tax=Arundo donax TaxID=35708 RepID=A0A0A8Z1J0_ARUDO
MGEGAGRSDSDPGRRGGRRWRRRGEERGHGATAVVAGVR